MFKDESELTEEEKKKLLEKFPKKPKQDAPQEQKDEFDRQMNELKIISEKIKEANEILKNYGKKSVEERSLEKFYKIIFEIADLNTDENGEPKYIFFGLEKQIAKNKFKISTKQIKRLADYLEGKTSYWVKDRSQYWNYARKKKDEKGDYLFPEIKDISWDDLSKDQKKEVIDYFKI